jgi:hypothetical protein
VDLLNHLQDDSSTEMSVKATKVRTDECSKNDLWIGIDDGVGDADHAQSRSSDDGYNHQGVEKLHVGGVFLFAAARSMRLMRAMRLRCARLQDGVPP